MTPEEHIEFWNYLLTGYGRGLLVFPKKEGAFYWGNDITYDEYCDKYYSELIKLGYIKDEIEDFEEWSSPWCDNHGNYFGEDQ